MKVHILCVASADDLEPPLYVGIALHGDSGPWGKCPNPKHPQNCSAMYRSVDASAGKWEPTAPLPANALIQPTVDSTSRGFSGKIIIDTTTNTTGSVAWKEWRWVEGVTEAVDSGVSKVTGLPLVFGQILSVLPSSIRLHDGNWLAVAYGATQADHLRGSGNRTCVPMFHWQAHFCASVFVLASADEGRSWRYRSSLAWNPSMGTSVGGPSEAALSLLPDGRVLAVYRVEEHENLWQSVSGDGGESWGAPRQTNAWSVFPQLTTTANGVTVLVSGRPGLGLWLLEDASSGRWRLYNLAKEHNDACQNQCGVNSTYVSSLETSRAHACGILTTS
jgi:hypothetical protein